MTETSTWSSLVGAPESSLGTTRRPVDGHLSARPLRARANRRQPTHKEPAIPRQLDVEAHLFARVLRPPKDVVAADTSPDDVRLSRALLLAVGERCSAVRGPRHLEDPVVPPDGLHAQAAPRPAVPQILDELGDSSKERFLRFAVERSEFPPEHALPFVGRHDGDRRRCERESARTAVAGPVGRGHLAQRSPGTRPRRRTPGRVCPRARSSVISCSPACHSSVQYHHWSLSRWEHGRRRMPSLVISTSNSSPSLRRAWRLRFLGIVTRPSDLSVTTPRSYPSRRCRYQEHCQHCRGSGVGEHRGSSWLPVPGAVFDGVGPCQRTGFGQGSITSQSTATADRPSSSLPDGRQGVGPE